MRRRTKVFVIVPLLLLLLAGGALAGTWVWASNAVRTGYETWRAERMAEGYSFQNADPQVEGFPTAVRATLRQPVVAAPQGWRWEGPVVTGQADVLSPFTVRVTAPGTHILRTTDGRRLKADAENAHGRLLLQPSGGMRSGQITLEQVTLDGLPAGVTRAAALFVALGPERRPPDGPHELDVTFETDGLELPAHLETAFGNRIDRLAVRGTLKGRAPRQWTRAELQAWRQRGGAIAVDHLELTWAPLSLQGDGVLSLDDRLRPSGTLDVAVSGLGPALDKLAAAGRIDRSAVNYAKLALAALGRHDSATGETRVDVPLSFRAGRVYLGPVPLGRLRPVLPAS
ncbi:DUF2125 domain-containing protein [Rhodovibrio salinarum]|nr:DUF2125 domain-containing protein [Rhodovibrio salinarum]